MMQTGLNNLGDVSPYGVRLLVRTTSPATLHGSALCVVLLGTKHGFTWYHDAYGPQQLGGCVTLQRAIAGKKALLLMWQSAGCNQRRGAH